MLTNEEINNIRIMRYNGATIRGISEKLNISTRTVQKHLKTDQKKLKPIILIDEIETLKVIVQDQEKRIEALKVNLETLKALKHSFDQKKKQESNTSTTKVPQTKEDIQKPEPDPKKKYYTVKDLTEITGLKARTLQEKCQKIGYNKINKHYLVPVDDLDKITLKRKIKSV